MVRRSTIEAQIEPHLTPSLSSIKTTKISRDFIAELWIVISLRLPCFSCRAAPVSLLSHSSTKTNKISREEVGEPLIAAAFGLPCFRCAITMLSERLLKYDGGDGEDNWGTRRKKIGWIKSGKGWGGGHGCGGKCKRMCLRYWISWINYSNNISQFSL